MGGTFNLPDLRGRMPLGVGQAFPAVPGGGTRTIGQKGGEEAHTLTEPQLPAVSGDLIAHGSVSAWWQPSGAFSGSQVTNQFTAGVASGSQASSVSVMRYGFGSGQAHNVLNPYAAVYYIIKVT